MRKKDLHSLRKANRRLVLGLLAEGAPLSRTEIAERTGLSASTVSTIMSDLLTEGLVHDTGGTESTGGRGRRLLGINPACGVMAIAEIQRQRTTVSFHDMGLGRLGARTLEVPIKPGAGDRLLQAICECVSAFARCAPPPGGLAGIGLLFDDQAIASDVTVLYSTGFDEASISLRQALITRFKVPVVEESAQACSARELVAAHLDNARSWAHIALGPRITLSLTTEEGPAPIGSRGLADLTEAVLPGQAHPERVLAALARACPEPGLIRQVVMGNVRGPGGNVARVAALAAGLTDVPALTIDRQCGSGLAAIEVGHHWLTAEPGYVIAGGVQSVSTEPLTHWRSEDGQPPRLFERAPFAPPGCPDPEMGEAARQVPVRHSHQF